MNESKWEILKYLTDNGVCPFDEWFNTLDSATQARIDVRLDRVTLGNFGDHHSVGSGVYELRFFFGPGYRIYYGIIATKVVLLLAGGSKKRQNRDIRTAQRFLAAYQNEQEGGI
jgi:putative addiction module killer protein